MRACNNNCIRCFIEEQSSLKESYPDIFIYYENKIPVFSCDTDVRRITQEMIDEELKRAPFAYIRSNGRIFYYRALAECVSRLQNVSVLLDFYSYNLNIHNDITKTRQGFEQMVRGINNLLAFNTSLLVNYHVGNFRRDLKELADLGVKDVRLAVSDYPDIQKAVPVIKEAVQYCDELGLNVTVDKYPRELGFLLGKVFVGPDQIAITVNNICNHKCIFCTDLSNVLIDDKNLHAFRNIKQCPNYGVLDLPRFKALIDDAAKIRVERIVITGGEPLIHSDIMEMLEYVKSKDMMATLLTNASLLNEEMSKKLVDMSLEILQVNLSAFDSPNYRIQHNISHANVLFPRIIKQLKILKEIKEKKNSPVPIVEIVFVMTRHLFGRFREMAELCSEVGASAAFFKPLQIMKSGLKQYLPTQKQVDEFHRNFQEYKAYFHKRGMRETLDELKFALETFSKTGEYYKSSYEEVPCSIAWKYAQISAQGEVSPCCTSTYGFMGNINEQELRDIWQGRRYKEFRWATQDKAFTRRRKECGICPNYLFDNLLFHNAIKMLELDKFIKRRDSEAKLRERVLA